MGIAEFPASFIFWLASRVLWAKMADYKLLLYINEGSYFLKLRFLPENQRPAIRVRKPIPKSVALDSKPVAANVEGEELPPPEELEPPPPLLFELPP